MTEYHPKRVAIEAHQWHRNGGHPADNCRTITPDPASTTQFAPFLSEGEIVRCYRNPDDEGMRECGDCGHFMRNHGWIDQGVFGRVVCPGDWVVSLPLSTPGLVAYFPVKPDVFAAAYEAAETTPGPSAVQSPQTAPRDGSAKATGPLAPILPAIRRALTVAISESTYEAEAKDYRAALAALDGSGEEAPRA